MRHIRYDRWIAAFVPLVLLGCASLQATPPPTVRVALADYERHLAALASDQFEGRKPGTAGERITVDYLSAQFRSLGVGPGNGVSYRQPVPLVEITAASDASLSLAGQTLRYPEAAVFWTKRVVPQVAVENSPLVFVGYGIVAPEYGWNDYAGVDMRGKTAVILVNDPGFASGDPALFRGRAMTYYGRWVYKFEEAARQGAAAALIIHETEPAAYPWQTVQNSWTGPQLDAESADGNASRVAIEGWITSEAADALLQRAGLSYADAKASALQREFKPLPLGVAATASLRNGVRRSESANVIATIPGARYPNEYIVYMAHWDHFGRSLGRSGDTIFNGAVDNATGTAALLAIAAAYQRASAPPDRSVVFMALTAEEAGLLGSAYYVTNPVLPLAQTVAAFNMDAIHFGGPTRDVIVVGAGASELEAPLERAAARQSRVLRGESKPEQGMFYRSDHFNFAKAGVPSLYIKMGIDDREFGAAWGQAAQEQYTARDYHQQTDEYRPGVDLRGGLENIQLFYEVGAELANSRQFPNWFEDNEFRAARDRSRALMTR